MPLRRCLLSVLALVALVGCERGTDVTTDTTVRAVAWPGEAEPAASHEIAPGVAAALPEGWEVDPVEPPPEGQDADCHALGGQLSAGSTVVLVSLVHESCAGVPQRPLNGDYGRYVGVDDVPEPRDVQEVGTPLGPASVLEQTYTECTQACVDTQQHVALISPDPPLLAGYPTVMLLTNAERVTVDRFTALLDALERSA